MTYRKEIYAARSMEVFKQYGLRISIDEIASKTGVTKKTIYNQFGSKEGLLKFCMQKLNKEMGNKIAVMYSEEVHAIAGFRSGIYGMGEVFHSLSPVFFEDLKKLFPDLSGSQHKMGFGSFLEGVKKNLIKGQNENLYRQDMDVDLISKFFITSVVSYFIRSVLTVSEYSARDYFKSMIDYHLHAVVTAQGLEVLDQVNHNHINISSHNE